MTKPWRKSSDPWDDCLDKIADRGYCRHVRTLGHGILMSELETDPPVWDWMPSKRDMVGLNSIPSGESAAS